MRRCWLEAEGGGPPGLWCPLRMRSQGSWLVDGLNGVCVMCFYVIERMCCLDDAVDRDGNSGIVE